MLLDKRVMELLGKIRVLYGGDAVSDNGYKFQFQLNRELMPRRKQRSIFIKDPTLTQ